MKNKILLSIMVLLLVGFGITMSITNHKWSQIVEVRKDVSQMTKQQKHVATQIDNVQTTYNANDATAKNKLLEFTKAYYTFSSQSDYDKRLKTKIREVKIRLSTFSREIDVFQPSFNQGLLLYQNLLTTNLGVFKRW